MQGLEDYLAQLRNLKSVDVQTVQKLARAPFFQEHELAAAYLASWQSQCGLPFELPPLPSNEAGALPLFARGFFSWGALPYPKEHAELGTLLLRLGLQNEDHELIEIARKMGRWQQGCLDHKGRPLVSLFNQEGSWTEQQIECAHKEFFASLEEAHLNVASPDCFVDEELGLVSLREKNCAAHFVGSGCKSGLGSFVLDTIGLLNFGPQLLPFGDCTSFGLATKPRSFAHEFSDQGFSAAFCTRMACENPRETGLSYLRDSGYSALWVEAAAKFEQECYQLRCHFEGSRPLSTCGFSLFAKAPAAIVSGTHKLTPRSLDRYVGPAQCMKICSQEQSISIEIKGATQMEVIPLAGDASFWGADFLIAYRFEQSPLHLTMRSE